MFEGMVIDGKCLELALEPQNEKDQKFLGNFSSLQPFFFEWKSQSWKM